MFAQDRVLARRPFSSRTSFGPGRIPPGLQRAAQLHRHPRRPAGGLAFIILANVSVYFFFFFFIHIFIDGLSPVPTAASPPVLALHHLLPFWRCIPSVVDDDVCELYDAIMIPIDPPDEGEPTPPSESCPRLCHAVVKRGSIASVRRLDSGYASPVYRDEEEYWEAMEEDSGGLALREKPLGLFLDGLEFW